MSDYIAHFFIGGIPAALVFSCFYRYRRLSLDARRLCSTPCREVALIIFLMCLGGITALVLWPSYRWEEGEGLWGNLTLLNARTGLTDGVNWIPSVMVRRYIESMTSGNFYDGALFLFGNIAMFMPLGFFPALLFRGQGTRQIARIAVGYSLSVEFLQFFLGRHCDIDDILLNISGAFLGYWLLLWLEKRFPELRARFLCRPIP